MHSSDAISCAVITVSDRVASGERTDASGPRAAERLREAGFAVGEPLVTPDGADDVHKTLDDAVRSGARFIVTTGGTGLSPRDQTPEGTQPHLARVLTGISEALRRDGAQHTPMAVLSRGLAGVTAGPQAAFIVNLPGSVRAVDQGLDVVLPLVAHIVDQLDGGDH